MYASVPNSDLQVLFSIYHTQLNWWFSVMNKDIRYQYDEKGNRVSLGGYFHAEDSRAYLSLLNQIDRLRSRLSDTPLAFSICDTKYNSAIAHTRRFVVKSGGSTIPEDFPEVEIQELQPIFQIKKSVAITQDANTIFADLKHIATGAYAKVSYYIDPVYNIPIAVKQALPGLNDKALVRFRQEYDILKTLHSPYILTVYAYNGKRNEYTMELMDETIQEYIGHYLGPNRVNLSLLQRKNIIRQVCRGFQYIHSKGLLHRDISLTNVFIKHYEDTDVVKIGDFGLVKIPKAA